MVQVKTPGPDFRGLVLLAALVSIEIARELEPEQLELLSAFFEVLGDDLSLLALSPGEEGDPQETA